MLIEYAIKVAITKKVLKKSIKYILQIINSNFKEQNQDILNQNIKTICVLPIFNYQNEILGVLQCVNRSNTLNFSDSDVETLKV